MNRTEMIEGIAKKYKVSPKSAMMYLTNYDRANEILGSDITDLDKVMEYLKDYKIATQRNYLYAIYRVNDFLGITNERNTEKFQMKYYALSDLADKERIERPKDIEPLDLTEKFSLLNKKINEATDSYAIQYLLQQKLVAQLYTQMPPRRAKDYIDMRITDIPTDELVNNKEYTHNYYNLRDFVFKNYKTFKSMGPAVITPPKKIKKTIQHLLVARGIDPGEFLFSTKTGKPYSNDTWGAFLKKATGKRVNQLRKIYANTNVNSLEVRNALRIARDMGHNIYTACKDYYGTEEQMKNIRQ